jgi:serine/threonine protein kinase
MMGDDEQGEPSSVNGPFVSRRAELWDPVMPARRAVPADAGAAVPSAAACFDSTEAAPVLLGVCSETTVTQEQSAPPVLSPVNGGQPGAGAMISGAAAGGMHRSGEAASAPAGIVTAPSAQSPSTEDNDDCFEERSPDGRFLRFPEVLGTGAYKTVYKGFDTDNGIEVAWNKLNIQRLTNQDTERVMNEVNILRSIQHPNIINLFAGWEVRDERGRVRGAHFITELMTSGTLKQYIAKVKTIKVKVIRKWCRNVLEAIHYLHSCTPPIMHRDLKCDNIFINGNIGEVKIGDLGLSSVKDRASKCGYTVIGTPEFMAPELYDENYSEKIDIYAFGMCMLEMVSTEYPYAECENAGQIFKKVLNGVLPEALSRMVECDLKRVILQCLASESQRPTALQLLNHPLFADWESDDGSLSNVDLMVSPNSGRSRSSLEVPRSMTQFPDGDTNAAKQSLTSNLSPSPSSTTVSRLSMEHAPSRARARNGDQTTPDAEAHSIVEHPATGKATSAGNITVNYIIAGRASHNASPTISALHDQSPNAKDSSAVAGEERTKDAICGLLGVQQADAAAGALHQGPGRRRIFEGVDIDEAAAAPPTRPIVRVIGRADESFRSILPAESGSISGTDTSAVPDSQHALSVDVTSVDATNRSGVNDRKLVYSGILVLSVRIPVSGAVKRITFAMDPYRESAEQVAREMVEELNLDEAQAENIAQAIDRQLDLHLQPTATAGLPRTKPLPVETVSSIPTIRVVTTPLERLQEPPESEASPNLISVPGAPAPTALRSSASPPVERTPAQTISGLSTITEISNSDTRAVHTAPKPSERAGNDRREAAQGLPPGAPLGTPDCVAQVLRSSVAPTAPPLRPASSVPNAAGVPVVVVMETPPSDARENLSTDQTRCVHASEVDTCHAASFLEGASVLYRPAQSAGAILDEGACLQTPVYESSALQPATSSDSAITNDMPAAGPSRRATSEPASEVPLSGLHVVTVDESFMKSFVGKSSRTDECAPELTRDASWTHAHDDPRLTGSERITRADSFSYDYDKVVDAKSTRSPSPLPTSPSARSSPSPSPSPPLDVHDLVQAMYGQMPALKRHSSSVAQVAGLVPVTSIDATSSTTDATGHRGQRRAPDRGQG